jgi:transposase-like protein
MEKIENTTTSRHNSRQAAGARDPEVVPKAKRRQFSAAYKLQIVEEADACTEPDEVGALLRREGRYSSHLTDWRRLRDAGKLQGGGKKRGRKADPKAAEIARLREENEQLSRELEKAGLIIDVQKKLAEVLGLTIPVKDDGP